MVAQGIPDVPPPTYEQTIDDTEWRASFYLRPHMEGVIFVII